MLDPLTPLGSDALRSLAASTARLLDYDMTWETQGAFRQAGERLWIDLTALLRSGFGRRLLHAALGQVEPSVREALLQVWDDPRLAVTSERPSGRTIRTAARLLLPLAGRLALALVRPEAAQREAAKSVGRAIRWYEMQSVGAQTLEQRLALLDEIAVSVRKFLLPGLFPRFVPGMASLYRLYRLCDELPAGRQLALELLRGLPNNVTTEMDLTLWEAARCIQRDTAAREAFQTGDSRSLTQAYLAKDLPPVGQQALAEFLSRYGMRGLGEIDLGRPRWRDDPAPVMEAVQSYVRIMDPAFAPDAVFPRGAAAAERAAERLAAETAEAAGRAAQGRAGTMVRAAGACVGRAAREPEVHARQPPRDRP